MLLNLILQMVSKDVAEENMNMINDEGQTPEQKFYKERRELLKLNAD